MDYDKIMIVAHPDDETIFGGAQLIQEEDWLVVCVTNGDHPIRRKEFTKVMNKLGAQHEIWSYEDRWNGDFDRVRLKSDLAEVLKRKPFTKVVTHNLQGEYGHTQHQVLSRLVHDLVDQQLYVFDVSKKKLEKDLLKEKYKLLKYYKSQDIQSFTKYIEYEGIRKIV